VYDDSGAFVQKRWNRARREMRGEKDEAISRVQQRHTCTGARSVYAALSLHLHACECLPLYSSSFTCELSPLCTNPRGNWFMMEPRIQTRPSCILICRRYQGTRRACSVSPLCRWRCNEVHREARPMRNECVMIGCFNSDINTTDFPIPMEPEKSTRWSGERCCNSVHSSLS